MELFSVKISEKYLASNYFSCQRSYVRTPKAFSHWHFEFLMARFWAVPVFCNEVWTVWSAYAMADYPAWPGRSHGKIYQHKSPLDNREIFIYSCAWLVGQRNSCWIKGLGKNPQKEWARSLFAVPFVQGLPSVTRWTSRKWHVCQSLSMNF